MFECAAGAVRTLGSPESETVVFLEDAANDPEREHEDENRRGGEEHVEGLQVLDVHHDITRDRHNGECDRGVDRNLTSAERAALHHGEDFDVKEEHQQVAEPHGFLPDHFPNRKADADKGCDGDRHERDRLSVGEPAVETLTEIVKLRFFGIDRRREAASAFGRVGGVRGF